MISLKTAPVQSQRRKILLRGEARIRKALYEEYRVGSKHARRRNRGGGEICFGIMRLQTLRNSVSPNFIHSSSLPHWIHGDTDARGESPSIDGDNRDTRCRRGVPSTRPSECRARTEEEYGIRGGGGILREEAEGRQTLGNARCTNCILVFFVLERDSSNFRFEHVASLLVLGRAHRYDSPESARSGSFDLAERG